MAIETVKKRIPVSSNAYYLFNRIMNSRFCLLDSFNHEEIGFQELVEKGLIKILDGKIVGHMKYEEIDFDVQGWL